MSSNPPNSSDSDVASAPDSSPIVNWDRIVHKNVRGADNEPVGMVIALPDNRDTIILTTSGSQTEYEIPRSVVSGFNGAEVFLSIGVAELGPYRVDRTEAHTAQHSEVVEAATPVQPQQNVEPPSENAVPLIEEKLSVTKQKYQQDALIIKEPITEIQTIEVPVSYETLIVEKRSVSERPASGIRPVTQSTKIVVPLTREQVQVTKEPYVKEEIVVKKKSVTETQTVSEAVTKERIKTEPNTSQRAVA